MRSSILVLISIFLILFSGCSSTDIAVINEPVSVTPYEHFETVDYSHNKIHEGKYFFIKTAEEFTGGAGETKYFMFVTPNSSTEIHARVSISSSVEFDIKIQENATVLTNGTPITPYNANRKSTYVNKLKPYAFPTGVNNGHLLWYSKVGSGRSSTGVSPSTNYEIIALPNTIYIFNMTKVAVTSGYLDVDFFWYEEEEES